MAVPLRNQQNMIGYGEAQVTQPKPSPFFDELNTQRQLAQKDRALDLQESGIKSKEKIAEQKDNENRIAKLSQIKNVKNNYAPELVDKYNKEVAAYIKSAYEDPKNVDLGQIFRFNTMAAKIDEMGTLASDVFKNNLKGDLVVSKDLEALLGGEYNLEGETIEDMIQTTASLLAQAAPNVDYNELGKASSLELRNNIEGIKPENSSMFGITFAKKMEQIGNSTVDRTYANVNPEAANFYAKKKIENLPSTKIKIANMAMDDGVDLEENPEAYDAYLNELAKQVQIQTNFLISERQAANRSESGGGNGVDRTIDIQVEDSGDAVFNDYESAKESGKLSIQSFKVDGLDTYIRKPVLVETEDGNINAQVRGIKTDKSGNPVWVATYTDAITGGLKEELIDYNKIKNAVKNQIGGLPKQKREAIYSVMSDVENRINKESKSTSADKEIMSSIESANDIESIKGALERIGGDYEGVAETRPLIGDNYVVVTISGQDIILNPKNKEELKQTLFDIYRKNAPNKSTKEEPKKQAAKPKGLPEGAKVVSPDDI
jgi:hypothetical protein